MWNCDPSDNMDVLTLMDWMPKLHAMQCCIRECLLALNVFSTFTFCTNCIKMKDDVTVVLSSVVVSWVNIAVATGSAGCNIKYFVRVTKNWRGFGDNGSVWAFNVGWNWNGDIYLPSPCWYGSSKWRGSLGK